METFMSWHGKFLFLLTIAFALAAPTYGQQPAPAQDPVLPPALILLRTAPVRVGQEYGTAFVIDYKERQYLVTAKHLVKNLPSKDATIQLFENLQWTDLRADILNCKSSEVDAVALRFDKPEKLSVNPAVEVSRTGAQIGAAIFFFGFPNFGREVGLYTLFATTGQHLPMVKRGILSASDWIDEDANLLYFDAFNNKGFSGGPIIAFDTAKKQWQIVAVVSGYLPEASQVRLQGHSVDSRDLVNSGVMIGYSIRHVLDAIDASTGKP
jgi:S1-C subfamily serine protease